MLKAPSSLKSTLPKVDSEGASFEKNAKKNLVVSYTLTPGYLSAEKLEMSFKMQFL